MSYKDLKIIKLYRDSRVDSCRLIGIVNHNTYQFSDDGRQLALSSIGVMLFEDLVLNGKMVFVKEIECKIK